MATVEAGHYRVSVEVDVETERPMTLREIAEQGFEDIRFLAAPVVVVESYPPGLREEVDLEEGEV